MGLFDFGRGPPARPRGRAPSYDEFVGDGEERSAPCLDLSPKAKGWQERLGALANRPGAGRSELGPRSPLASGSLRAPLARSSLPTSGELALTAFTLVRGGDLFERPKAKVERSDPRLVDVYAAEQLRVVTNAAAKDVVEAAERGVLRVLRGNPALLKRMLIAKPVRLVLVPKGRDYRELGFPRNTNPYAAGIFWNGPKDEEALVGLREERVLEKPWLAIHEMAHAVHFLAFTQKEREDIDEMLLPVYRSHRWVEEAVAIYAERAFGAVYGEDDLEAPGLYGKTRRDWSAQHVFAKFIEELFRPSLGGL